MLRVVPHKRLLWIGVMSIVASVVLWAPLAAGAQDVSPEGASTAEPAAETLNGMSISAGIRTIGLALSAALAIGLACLATSRVQAAVGASGTGAMAEKPEIWTYVLVLFAIPETLVVFGFVIAILLITRI